MTPNEYQELAGRTECDQKASLNRMIGLLVDIREIGKANLVPIRLNHAVLGLAGEVGELAGAVERWIYYGKALDTINVFEELGDCLWYIAEACNCLGLQLEEVMAANIRKLKTRYPAKYDAERAAEENRDRGAERAAILADKRMVCSRCRWGVFQVDGAWRHTSNANEPGLCVGGQPVEAE